MKALKKLPGPKGMPLVGVFPEYVRNFKKIHQVEQRFCDEYGPIHLEKMLNQKMVVLSSPETVEELVRSEGTYPVRVPLVTWEAHRDIRGIPRGLVSSVGEDWRMCRNTFSKPLLRPTEVKQYRSVVKSSLEQLSCFLQNNLRSDTDKGKRGKDLLHNPDLVTLLKAWSLEIACSITFGENQKLLTYPLKKETLQFIEAIDHIFEYTKIFFFLPPEFGRKYLKFTEKNNKLLKLWDEVFAFCEPQIKSKLRDLSKTSSSSNPNEAINENSEDEGFLDIVVKNSPNISEQQIFSSVTEIILGAIDQTSLTLAEMLGEIAFNKTLQSDLRAEICSLTLGDNSNTFLRATLKEGFRMFPSMTRVPRSNTETISIAGYQLPPQTNIMIASYAMGRNAKYFEEPHNFNPQRWLSSSTGEMSRESSPFLLANFGFGSRMCLGKRLAEMQLYEALIFILKNYRIDWDSDKPMELYSTGLLTPVDTSPLKFYAL